MKFLFISIIFGVKFKELGRTLLICGLSLLKYNFVLVDKLLAVCQVCNIKLLCYTLWVVNFEGLKYL